MPKVDKPSSTVKTFSEENHSQKSTDEVSNLNASLANPDNILLTSKTCSNPLKQSQKLNDEVLNMDVSSTMPLDNCILVYAVNDKSKTPDNAHYNNTRENTLNMKGKYN